ncbi:IS200/IS605 family transposase [Candidatus Omnitrophota bacterium]
MYYHIWFVTKHHRPTLVGKIEKMTKGAFLEVARNKKYTILETETNKDHVHLLVEAKDRKGLANMVRTLKCVSAKKVLEEIRSTPRLRTGNVRSFWARGYGRKIAHEPQIKGIRDYIRNQKRIPHT